MDGQRLARIRAGHIARVEGGQGAFHLPRPGRSKCDELLEDMRDFDVLQSLSKGRSRLCR